ncbi:MAG TPA: cobalamin-dependent protein [Vicinamibacterales bacterium]|nr:cobalamin-dependent protein [Vicinamibacterales bacterium]
MRHPSQADTVEVASDAYCDALTKKFLTAQLAADRQAAMRVVIDEGVQRGVDPRRIMLDVIRPAQRQIGQLWQDNAISIADEHIATAISQLALAQLYSYAERHANTERRILVACVDGELHDMGARLAADMLDLEGHDVIFLGASVPADSLVARARADRPDLIVLSITMTFHIAALREAVEKLRHALSPAPPIAAGGRALSWCPELKHSLDLAASGEDARALITDVQRYFRK